MQLVLSLYVGPPPVPAEEFLCKSSFDYVNNLIVVD